CRSLTPAAPLVRNPRAHLVARHRPPAFPQRGIKEIHSGSAHEHAGGTSHLYHRCYLLAAARVPACRFVQPLSCSTATCPASRRISSLRPVARPRRVTLRAPAAAPI